MKPNTSANAGQANKPRLINLSTARNVLRRISVEIDGQTTFVDVKLNAITRSYVEELVQSSEVGDFEITAKIMVRIISRWGFIDSRETILEAFEQFEKEVAEELGEDWRDNIESLTEEDRKDLSEEEKELDLCYVPVCIVALKGLFPSFGQNAYWAKLYEKLIEETEKNPTPSAGGTKS